LWQTPNSYTTPQATSETRTDKESKKTNIMKARDAAYRRSMKAKGNKIETSIKTSSTWLQRTWTCESVRHSKCPAVAYIFLMLRISPSSSSVPKNVQFLDSFRRSYFWFYLADVLACVAVI